MKHLVEFPLDEGGSIIVEIDEAETAGTIRAGRGEIVEKAKETLEDALNKVLPATKSVVNKLRSMDHSPDEIEVTFGINLSTTVGAFIASTKGQANFDITIRWSGKAKDATSQATEATS
jgi:hypothetical protein